MSDEQDKPTRERIDSIAKHIGNAFDELTTLTSDEVSRLSEKGSVAVKEALSSSAEKAQGALNQISEALEVLKTKNSNAEDSKEQK